MMSGQPDSDPEKPKRRSLAWYQAWSRVLANPSIASFDLILDDPRVSTWRALRWLFLSVTLGLLLLFVTLQVLTGSLNLEWLPYGLLICAIVGLLFTMNIAFFVGCVNLVARLMNGTGTYGELLYAFAAFVPALYFIEIPLAFLTTEPVFFLALRLYRIVLIGLAVRAVHRLPWWKTGLAIVIGTVVTLYLGGTSMLF